MNKKNKIIRISIILIVIISSIMAFNILPNEMAINFSLSGDINYSVNKLIGLLICPVILIITYILVQFNKNSPCAYRNYHPFFVHFAKKISSPIREMG